MDKQLTFDDFNKIELIEVNGMYSLTDLWKKHNDKSAKNPSKWTKQKGTKEFINYVKRLHNCESVVKVINGDNGGTFAHWQIALAYAKYLSPELHAKVNQVFKERLEENANPELGIQRSHDRAIDNYKKQGKNDKWIQNRLSGIQQRKVFTDTLSGHDCNGYGIGWSTNEIYKPTIGGTAKETRRNRNIPAKSNLRDHLTATEIAAINLAETLAIDKIESEKITGNYSCAMASKKAGCEVKKAVDNVLKPQLKG